MNYALYRSLSNKESLVEQEEKVVLYANSLGQNLQNVYADFAPLSRELDEREEFKSYLHSMKDDDTLFIYDLWALSTKVGELVKILTCLFKKNIFLHISERKLVLDKTTDAFLVVGLLNEQRETNIKEQHKGFGRPKGSRSKSKFDDLRPKIINMLSENANVSEISRVLKVNRSSLKDYINSRRLKEIAQAWKDNQGKNIYVDGEVLADKEELMEQIECPFKKEQMQKELQLQEEKE